MPTIWSPWETVSNQPPSGAYHVFTYIVVQSSKLHFKDIVMLFESINTSDMFRIPHHCGTTIEYSIVFWKFGQDLNLVIW